MRKYSNLKTLKIAVIYTKPRYIFLVPSRCSEYAKLKAKETKITDMTFINGAK